MPIVNGKNLDALRSRLNALLLLYICITLFLKTLINEVLILPSALQTISFVEHEPEFMYFRPLLPPNRTFPKAQWSFDGIVCSDRRFMFHIQRWGIKSEESGVRGATL